MDPRPGNQDLLDLKKDPESPPRSLLCTVCRDAELHELISPSSLSPGSRLRNRNLNEMEDLRVTWDFDNLRLLLHQNCPSPQCVFCTYLLMVLGLARDSSIPPPQSSLSPSPGTASVDNAVDHGGNISDGPTGVATYSIPSYNVTPRLIMIQDGMKLEQGKLVGRKKLLCGDSWSFRWFYCLALTGEGLQGGSVVAGFDDGRDNTGRLLLGDNNGSQRDLGRAIHVRTRDDGIENDKNDLSKVRNVGAKVNPDLFRAWLRRCETEHVGGKGHDCDWIMLWGAGVVRMFLIDVEKGCITPALSNYRYIALSYVWGKAKQLQLTLENLNQLQIPGSLAVLIEGASDHSEQPEAGDIPNTIRDAIRLCQIMGERYLWVDSLCIVQDDTIHKAEQLSRMGAIYNCALMTIVAACGSDANAPLPGISSDRDLHKMGIVTADIPVPIPDGSIEMLHVSSRDTTWVQGVVQSSVWHTRAWTLQEMLLSRRLLVFTPSGQVFFRCRSCTWLEDLVLDDVVEDVLIKRVEDAEFLKDWNKWNSRRGNRNDWDRHWWGMYSHLIESLMSRSLSFESDILNAASGLLSAMEDQLGDFFWGLPKKYFAKSLFWTLKQITYPVRRPGFPSWSWTGWKYKFEEKLIYPDRINNLLGIDAWPNMHYSPLIFYQYDSQADSFLSLGLSDKLDNYFADLRYARFLDGSWNSEYLPEENGAFYYFRHFDPPSPVSLEEDECPPEVQRQLKTALEDCVQASTPGRLPVLDPSQLVLFWTSAAQFEVDMEMIKPVDDGARAVGVYKVLAPDSKSRVLGKVHLDPGWRTTRGAKLDFIALTLSGGPTRVGKTDKFAHKFYIRVMLVDWGVSSSGFGHGQQEETGWSHGRARVAYRVAIMDGTIPSGDWVKQKPQQRLVVLG